MKKMCNRFRISFKAKLDCSLQFVLNWFTQLFICLSEYEAGDSMCWVIKRWRPFGWKVCVRLNGSTKYRAGGCKVPERHEMWFGESSLSSRSMLLKTYQTPKHCTADYNTHWRDFTTLEINHSTKYFIFHHDDHEVNSRNTASTLSSRNVFIFWRQIKHTKSWQKKNLTRLTMTYLQMNLLPGTTKECTANNPCLSQQETPTGKSCVWVLLLLLPLPPLCVVSSDFQQFYSVIVLPSGSTVLEAKHSFF